jgi:hypothetical protein
MGGGRQPKQLPPGMPQDQHSVQGLAYGDAQLEQFAMNARRAPERVGDADVADKLADFSCGLRPSTWTARFPAPSIYRSRRR